MSEDKESTSKTKAQAPEAKQVAPLVEPPGPVPEGHVRVRLRAKGIKDGVRQFVRPLAQAGRVRLGEHGPDAPFLDLPKQAADDLLKYHPEWYVHVRDGAAPEAESKEE